VAILPVGYGCYPWSSANPNYTGLATIGFDADPCEPTNLFQNQANIKHTDMLTRLFNNAEFTQTYKDNWIQMFNGPLNCVNMLAHYDSVVNILTPEMNRQAIKWGGTMAGWQANCAQMRTYIRKSDVLLLNKN
jgi:hypothetical protein